MFMVSYYVSLRSEFRVVMSAIIYAWKWCSVRVYLQLFVRGILSYLRYFVCLCIVISNTYCVVFLPCLSLSCVSIFIAPSVFSNVLFCIVTGVNSTEAHYVETIPATLEQPCDTIWQRIRNYKTVSVTQSEMSYPFIRNTSENGTRFGRMTNLQYRYLTKYNLQCLLERVNEIAVKYCALISKLNLTL